MLWNQNKNGSMIMFFLPTLRGENNDLQNLLLKRAFKIIDNTGGFCTLSIIVQSLETANLVLSIMMQMLFTEQQVLAYNISCTLIKTNYYVLNAFSEDSNTCSKMLSTEEIAMLANSTLGDSNTVH